MSQRLFIRELAPNQWVEGVFAVQNCQLGLTRGGKNFLKCLLADRTGRTPGRMWNVTEDLVQSLPTNGFVEIEGQTQPYQGEMQIIIQRIRAASPSEEELMDLLPATERDVEQMFDELCRLLERIASPSLQALVRAYLDDAPLMAKFRQAPAATQLHHAYLGGLLEHTLTLLRLADVVLPLYPQLNGDLVRVGLFLHDLAKCEELTWEAGFSYSDDGQLVGHIARGLIWLDRKAQACAAAGTPLSEELVRVLHHILISHHGQVEFGAMKVPATPEAILVSLLDNVDARVHMAIAAGRGEAGRPDDLGGNFSERIWALGTRIYRPDPLAGEAEGSGVPDDDDAAAQPEPLPPEQLQKQLRFGDTGRGRGGL